MDELYTVDELAEVWKCKPQLIYRLLNTGELEGLKIGGRTWRIPAASRTAYEEAHLNTSKRVVHRQILKIT